MFGGAADPALVGSRQEKIFWLPHIWKGNIASLKHCPVSFRETITGYVFSFRK
jgi:hypothetical protein